MNKDLYQKIKQTIIEKDCLYQVDDDKKDSIIHNISAYVAEMLENKKQNVETKIESKLYDFNTFKDKCSLTLYSYFCDECSNDGYSVCIESDRYYDKFEQFWSNLLTKELNEK
jgi:hypothetical protein